MSNQTTKADGTKATKEAKIKADADAKAAEKTNADAKAKALADIKPKSHFIIVKALGKRSHRRAGIRFSPEGTRIDVAALSEEQKKAIQNDPMLKPFEDTSKLDAEEE